MLLVGGRERAPGLSNRVEYYEEEKGEWQEANRLFFPRDAPAVCTFNGSHVYVFGGMNNIDMAPDMEPYVT